VENIKNNILNYKMIILYGPSRSGKTTLKNDIQSYLGDETCGTCIMSGEIIYNENIKKLGFFCGIDEISRSQKTNRAIINLIKYKQSFIAVTDRIERVNPKLFEFSKIIEMEHIF
jgi:DNA helicase TIP49 (TBP-interacting protein)